MTIFFDNEEAISEELIGLMKKSAEICLAGEGVDEGRTELSVSFVSGEEIKELNSEYRNTDRITDVLSFPQFESPQDFPEEGEISLGDVVICNDKIEEQAEEYGTGIERETVYLFTHSILHLLGYDHEEEEERRIMREKEEKVMEELGIPMRKDA